MPLLGRKVVHLVKPLTDLQPADTVHTIPHTQEQFRSKAEYDKRVQLYKDEVWTCQCTGHINLTHEEAFKSEQEKFKILKDQFPQYFEKTVLELIHHSTEILDNLVDQAWTKIQQAFAVGEMVSLRVKAQGKTIKGKVVRVDTSLASPRKEGMPNGNCNSPSSDKENSANTNTNTEQSAAKSDSDTSPAKWVHPKLLPYKYSFRLEDEDKIISGIPAVDLQRVNRTPTKDLVKLFVRGFSLRHGTHPNSPWVVTEHLVKKFGLKSKYADFLVSPQKMSELGRRAAEESTKRRRSSKGETSVTKKPKLDVKSPTQKTPKLNPDGTPRKRGRPRKINTQQATQQSPQKTPKPGTPRKRGRPRKVDIEVKVQQKEAAVSSSSSDSDSDSSENVALVNLTGDKLSPGTPKSKRSSPRKRSLADLKRDMEENEPLAVLKKSPQKNTPNANGTPKKRGRPRKNPEEVKTPKKRGRPRKDEADKSPRKTPKKGMKQMTLFEVKGKGRGRPPKSPGKSPAKSPRKGPVKLPPMVTKLQKALKVKNTNNKTRLEYNQLLNRVAKGLTKREQAVLPADIKDTVMCKIGILDEKKKLAKMNPAQREEYLKKRKEEKKEEMKRKLRLYAMERKKKIEDTDLDLKPLPTPKLVPTPDGIANELFGDIIMITEFINGYRGLLLPEDERLFTADQLMKSLAGEEESYHYMAQLLQVLLQTLLQDGIAEDYKDLGVSLANVTITPLATSELVRLCLRKLDFNEDEDSEKESEDSRDENNDSEVPEELVEQLETTELWSMTPQEKLAIILALCHRVMGSYSVQDYMMECQKNASELWRRRVAEGKAKNDRIKEEKLKKKEMKEKKKVEPEEVQSSDATDDKKQAMTIKDFYGKDTPVEEEMVDLASVVKRRRVMAALAAEEKRKRDIEERLRREKEAEELRKQKDKEAFEKEFLEGIALAKLVQRQSPVGTDRDHNRYWIFHGAAPGLYIEKGWAPPDIDYKIGPQDDTDLSDLDSDFDDSSEESEAEKKRGRRSMADIEESNKRKEKTLPHKGQNLWFVYDNISDIQRVLNHLHPQGIREHSLKENLQKHLAAVEAALKQAHKEKAPPVAEEKDIKEGLRLDLMDIEMRLRSGGLGGIDNFTDWEKNLQKATGIQDFGECLIETQSFILDKFFKGLMAPEKTKLAVKEELIDDSETKESQEENVHRGVQRWVEAIRCCPTISRLHVLMGMLDSCIRWERSAENAKCKICRKKGDDMLLCDDCNQAFHMYCLRPALLDIPSGDWYCPACIPTTQRRGSRNKDYRKMAEGDSDTEESSSEEEGSNDEDEIEAEEECTVCGGDESLVSCSTCPLAYHLDCHTPPLLREPRSNWRCNHCKTGAKIPRRRVDNRIPRRPTRSIPKKYTYSSSGSEEDEEEENDVEEDEDSDSATETEDEPPPSKRQRTQVSTQVSPRGGGHGVNGGIPNIDQQVMAMKEVLSRLMKHRHSWPFHDPVDADDVPDYYQIVKDPINLQDIVERIEEDSYESSQDFVNDIALLFENADLYNKSDSEVGRCIQPLEKAFRELLQRYLPGCYYRRDYKPNKTGAGLNDHAYSSHT